MPIESLERILQQHSFLSDLEDRHVHTLVGCAANQRFGSGEYLFREGENADFFYLIRSGQIALEMHVPQRGGLRIETLSEGDVLGWSWLIAPYRWRFDAKAVTPVLVLALDGRCLRTKCEEDHDLGYQLLKRFSALIGQRLESPRLQLMDIYGAKKK